MKPRVIALARVPRCGIGKTRLARGLGQARAAQFQRIMLAQMTRALASDPRWQFIFALAGGRTLLTERTRATPLCVAQSQGSLGERMGALAQAFFPAPLIFLGTDLPNITAADIARALRSLRTHEAVLGPAHDGGFWLLGLRPPRRDRWSQIFARVRWSHPATATDMRAALTRVYRGTTKTKIATLDERRDIDTIEDYRAWTNSF